MIDGHNDIAEQLAEYHDYSIVGLASCAADWPVRPDKDLAALAGGNVRRARRGAEATASSLRGQRAAMDKLPATP